ncbi:MAG: sigma-70 family RNA polymerase sigma factor [Phycisphaerae bacterium]|nr:sigma-70 family RNA polymerase sigma factor [Phycisphaerae bacterium]
MIDVTRTTTRLLEGLHHRTDGTAWEEFDRRYRPILIGFLRSLGASEIDAADISQDALVRFLTEYRAGRFDRTRGRLRNWLMSIGRTQMALARRREAARREQLAETPSLDAIAAETDAGGDDAIWEAQRRRVILREAFDRLKSASASSERTLEAFERIVFHAESPAQVAEALSMSMGDVYQAKSRTTQRLRALVEEVERAYDEDSE